MASTRFTRWARCAVALLLLAAIGCGSVNSGKSLRKRPNVPQHDPMRATKTLRNFH